MAIPKYAKRVFKGIMFDIYHWQQKMFDGSFKTFEAIKREPSVVVIPTHKDKIVVLKQKQPGTGWFYCTPSGRMDKPGESPKEAALRELLEETGMRPKNLKLWKKVNKGGKIDWTVYVFIARDCEKVQEQNLDSGEKIEVNLLSYGEFLKLSDHPTRHIEETVFDMLKAKLDPKYKKELKKIIFG